MRLSFTTALAILLYVLAPFQADAQSDRGNAASLRSFDAIFPELSAEQRTEIFDTGIVRPLQSSDSLQFIPATTSGINLNELVLQSNPSFLAELIVVVPYESRVLNQLDAYNALANIRGLEGRLYPSHTKKAEVPLFEEATRLESERRHVPLADPPPAQELPDAETIFIRVKDVSYGAIYYRAEFSVHEHGVVYYLRNFRSISFLFLTIVKEEELFAALYLEPLVEGMLIYSVGGANVPAFVARHINIPSSIAKRATVFINWASDGVRAAQ